jgi:hypothetical protein
MQRYAIWKKKKRNMSSNIRLPRIHQLTADAMQILIGCFFLILSLIFLASHSHISHFFASYILLAFPSPLCKTLLEEISEPVFVVISEAKLGCA